MNYEEVESFVSVFRENPELAELEVCAGTRSLRLRRSFQLGQAGEIHGISRVHTDQQDVGGTDAARLSDGDQTFVFPNEENINGSGSKALSRDLIPSSASLPTTHVTASLVGVFRMRRSPVLASGSQIEEGGSLGQIEAMRLFNDCPSPIAGHISAIYVQDGEPVEFGQALFDLTALEPNL